LPIELAFLLRTFADASRSLRLTGSNCKGRKVGRQDSQRQTHQYLIERALQIMSVSNHPVVLTSWSSLRREEIKRKAGRARAFAVTPGYLLSTVTP
jgi:hypothetical protein